MKEKHTVIIDQIGRTILGVEVGNTTHSIVLKNPIILHFQPSQNGQLELQIFPLFFFELLERGSRDANYWTFDKSSIAVGDVTLNQDILSRYSEINTPKPSGVPSGNSKVISIDDL